MSRKSLVVPQECQEVWVLQAVSLELSVSPLPPSLSQRVLALALLGTQAHHLVLATGRCAFSTLYHLSAG